MTDVSFNSFSSTQWQQTTCKIGSIQIDNQSNNNALFPTILQPRIFKQLTGRDQYGAAPMIEVNIVMNVEKPHIVYIDEMDVTLQGIVVKCDDEFLGYALTFVYDVLEMLKTNLTGVHPLFKPPIIEDLDGIDDSKDDLGFYAKMDKGAEVNIFRRYTPMFKGQEGVHKFTQQAAAVSQD